MPAQYHLHKGLNKKLFDADAQAAPVNSTEYGVPARTGDGDGGTRFRWRYSFASAPSAASIVLQGSMNPNEPVPVWFDLDTGTNTAGEAREIVANVRGIRGRKATQTGGGALTQEVLI